MCGPRSSRRSATCALGSRGSHRRGRSGISSSSPDDAGAANPCWANARMTSAMSHYGYSLIPSSRTSRIPRSNLLPGLILRRVALERVGLPSVRRCASARFRPVNVSVGSAWVSLHAPSSPETNWASDCCRVCARQLQDAWSLLGNSRAVHFGVRNDCRSAASGCGGSIPSLPTDVMSQVIEDTCLA